MLSVNSMKFVQGVENEQWLDDIGMCVGYTSLDDCTACVHVLYTYL